MSNTASAMMLRAAEAYRGGELLAHFAGTIVQAPEICMLVHDTKREAKSGTFDWMTTKYE